MTSHSSPESDVCLVSAMVALVEHGLEPDVTELLVRGDPSRGIAPGALKKAIEAALGAHAQGAISLAFTERELTVVRELAEYHQVSELQTMRQALRLYQLNDRRIRDGETVVWSGDAQRVKDFAGSLMSSTQAPAQLHQDHVAWAVSRWTSEVANRPLKNVHRRSLDTTWRQVIRHFGGDDVALCGPPHDELASPVTSTVSNAGQTIKDIRKNGFDASLYYLDLDKKVNADELDAFAWRVLNAYAAALPSTERGLCDCGLPLKSCAECRQAFPRPEHSPQANADG